MKNFLGYNISLRRCDIDRMVHLQEKYGENGSALMRRLIVEEYFKQFNSINPLKLYGGKEEYKKPVTKIKAGSDI